MVNIVMTVDELPSQRRRRLRAMEDMEPRPPRDPWKMALGILTLEAAFALLIAYASETKPRDVVVKVALPVVKPYSSTSPPLILAQSHPAPPPVVGRRSVIVPLPAFEQPRIAPMTLAAESAPLSRRGRIDSLPGRAYARPVHDAIGGEDGWEDRLRSSRDQSAIADRPAPPAAHGPDGLVRRPGVVAGDAIATRPRQVLEAMAPASASASMAESLLPATSPRAAPDRLITQPDRPLAPDGQELPWIEDTATQAGDHPGGSTELATADNPAPPMPAALGADDLAIQPVTAAQDPANLEQILAETLTPSPDLAEAAVAIEQHRSETMPTVSASALVDTTQTGRPPARADGFITQPTFPAPQDANSPPRTSVADALDRRAVPAAGMDLLPPTPHRLATEPMVAAPPSALTDAAQVNRPPARSDRLSRQPSLPTPQDTGSPARTGSADALDPRVTPAAGMDLLPPVANRPIAENMAILPNRPLLAEAGRSGGDALRPDGLSVRSAPDLHRDSASPLRASNADALDRRIAPTAGSDLIAPGTGRMAADSMSIAPQRSLRDPMRPNLAARAETLARPATQPPPAEPLNAPRPAAAESLTPSHSVADAVASRLRGRGSGEAIMTSLPTRLADPGGATTLARSDGLNRQAGIGPSRDAVAPIQATSPDPLAQQPTRTLTDALEDAPQPGAAGDPMPTQAPAALTDPARPQPPRQEGADTLPGAGERRLLAERAPPTQPAAERLEQPTAQAAQDLPRPVSRPGARGGGIDRMASVTGPTLADTGASPWQAVETLDRAATLQREAAVRPVAVAQTGDIGIDGFDVHAMFDYGRHLRAGGAQVSYLPYGLAHDARSLTALFDGIDYAVGEGAHIPGVFLRRLPRDIASLPGADDRKMLFVRAVLPLIVHENEKNLTIRQRVLKLAPEIQAGQRLATDDQAFIDATLARFRMGQFDLMELLARIDVIPPSLALAQAAEESGWGTSRMAREGNALFGEVMWRTTGTDENGKIVREQRPFDDLATGVEAYMRNLNTHRAYHDFRRRRAAIRASGGFPDGHTLAPYLLRYSERGGDYVQAIRTLIELNNLVAFDSVRFRATSPKDTDQIAQPPEGAKGSPNQ